MITAADPFRALARIAASAERSGPAGPSASAQGSSRWVLRSERVRATSIVLGETGRILMADAAQIQEHAEVVGSDGVHVGTVDHVDKGEIKLTKRDAAAGGLHHYIPLDFVQSVTDGKVHLDRPADEVKREWSTS
jgi:hypothetical protein